MFLYLYTCQRPFCWLLLIAGSPQLPSYLSCPKWKFFPNLSGPVLTETTSFLPWDLRYRAPSCLETGHLGTALTWLARAHPHSQHALSEPPANLPVPIFPPITDARTPRGETAAVPRCGQTTEKESKNAPAIQHPRVPGMVGGEGQTG